MSFATLVGVVASLYLANNHPLALIALSPLPRHLVLVAPTVDPAAFLLVATARSLSFFVVCFYLGRAFGPAALVWLELRAPRMGRFVRWLERAFAHASYPAVLLLAGPAVAVIAGAAGMKAVVFSSLAAVALMARLVLILEVGDWLSGPLEAVRSLIGIYWIPGTFLLVLGISLSRWRGRGRREEMEGNLR
ncbi:MAG: hypothetical protein P8R42_10415 [Candidatus Binatia bacterium]|nr:hypothetical protein [Candidatus Binatia bacterium]